jgi:glycosyltransferase involved in cell wall biosynthesis
VTVFTSDLKTEFPMERLDGPYGEVDGVPVRRFHARSMPGDLHYVTYRGLKAALVATDADIYHAHSYGYPHTHAAAAAAKRHGRPFVYTPHFHPPYSTTGGWTRKRLRAVYDNAFGRRPFAAADLVIAVSSAELQWMRPMIPLDTRTTVIPNGIDLKDFQGPGDGRAFRERHALHGPLLLYTGRLAANKRLDTVIEHMPALLKEFPDLDFVAVGEDHGMGKSWKELAEKLGVGDHVRFLGHLSRAELVESYRACDAFVLPSDYEAFGIVLLEAMACGKPCVATRVGGVQDVIRDKETGLLVEFGDKEALKEALTSLLGDHTARRELGGAARQSVGRHFDWDAVVDRIEAEYHDLLDGRE